MTRRALPARELHPQRLEEDLQLSIHRAPACRIADTASRFRFRQTLDLPLLRQPSRLAFYTATGLKGVRCPRPAGNRCERLTPTRALRTRAALTRRARLAGSAALRKLRPSRRLAEIGCFVLLWIAGIALGLAGLDTTGAWRVAVAPGRHSSPPDSRAQCVFLLSHDGHHRLLFRNARVNHAANVLLLHATAAAFPRRPYRVLHELHHRFLGGP